VVAPRWSTTADGGVSLSVLDLIAWARARVRRHCGDWHSFRDCLAHYPANDLTVIVPTNLGEALPSLLVQGIAEIVDPTLAWDLTPMPDTEP